MRNDQHSTNNNPYEKPTKIVSAVLAAIFTFFVFPYAFLSVAGVQSFAGEHYPWLPELLIAIFWALLLLAVLFALTMLLCVLGINVALKYVGKLMGRA